MTRTVFALTLGCTLVIAVAAVPGQFQGSLRAQQGAAPNVTRGPQLVTDGASPSRLSSELRDLQRAFLVGSPAAASALARTQNLAVVDDAVQVAIATVVGQETAVQQELIVIGARIEGVIPGLIEGRIPIGSLDAAAAITDINSIGRPLRMQKFSVSEGVSGIGAPAWNTKGATGFGVKVGILDGGFAGYADLLGTELPATVTTRSFRSDGDITGGGESHGVSVTEVVYDIAPDATFYLANAATVTEISKAVDYLVDQKVSVINFSAGWSGCIGPLDGTGPVNDIVRRATSKDILWVNAAGNDGKHHWSGTFNDSDGNGWHNFSGTDEGNSYPMSAGDEVSVCLQWDDWKATSQDYDLYVLDSMNKVVASATNRQAPTGFGQPIEAIDFTALVADRYSFAIRNVNGARALPMHLFVHILKANGGQECVTEAALARQPAALSQLNMFRALRDNVFERSGAGRLLTNLYYRHSDELRGLLLADVTHVTQTVELLANLRPAVRALTTAPSNGDPSAVFHVDPLLVAKTRALFDYLDGAASSGLREDLRLLRDAADLDHAAGRAVWEYWETVERALPSGPPSSPFATTPIDPLEYHVSATSLSIPADSADVFTVGAVYFGDESLEDYSSQGPTVDGRLKPDISAPTRVCTKSAGRCGDSGFAGTSASAPHVTGAAVLVKQIRPAFTRVQIQNFLQLRAVDRGTLGPDTEYGAGSLALGAVPSDVGATIAFDRTGLVFGATNDGVSLVTRTASQTVRVAQTGLGTVKWSVTPTQPWILVSPSSGIGPGILTVSVAFSSGLPAKGAVSGAISISSTGALNALAPLPVSLSVIAPTLSTPPTGVFDTPTDGTLNLNGSIAVTGWALDDVEVTEVQIWRDPSTADPGAAIFAGPAPQGGKVFVGYASFVEGARPDIETRSPSSPMRARAGWGYLLLTRGLSWDGRGPFKLYAIAADREGHLALLGSKTISINNGAATKPFGAIDTPGQGTAASGLYPNTGWVITPNAGATIPAGGVQVAVDGVLLPGVPSVSNRADLTAGFPSLNTAGAGRGLFIDTTQYSNGTHTIGWLVTDSTGKADGVGSRFFTIANGALLTRGAPARPDPAQSESVDALPAAVGRITGRRGFDQSGPFEALKPERILRVLHAEELDRIELRLDDHPGGDFTGYLRVGARLAPLPIGSHLEGRTFTWQPGAGFLGGYDMVFVRGHQGVPAERQEVHVTLHPQGTFTRPQIVIDAPGSGQTIDGPFTVAGWALDPDAPSGSAGIASVHVWAYPVRGGAPIFVGHATFGARRPDLAALYGERSHDCGFELTPSALPPGTYDLAVFAWSEFRGRFLPATVLRIEVR